MIRLSEDIGKNGLIKVSCPYVQTIKDDFVGPFLLEKLELRFLNLIDHKRKKMRMSEEKTNIDELKSILLEISEALVEIRAWYRQTPRKDIKSNLESILDTPNKIIAYHFSDGGKTTRNLAKISKAGTGSISRWWTDWIKFGIAIPIKKGAGNRAKKLFDLKDYGISIPDLENLSDEEE